MTETNETNIRAFVADWFQRFDRLDPIESFLPDLHTDVIWEMADVDLTLTGHDRVRAWYRGVLETFHAPTEHHVSDLKIDDGKLEFTVLFRARTKENATVDAKVHEEWRFETRPDGRPLITKYTATLI